MRKKIKRPNAPSTRKLPAAPTPIPAIAPVLRPEVLWPEAVGPAVEETVEETAEETVEETVTLALRVDATVLSMVEVFSTVDVTVGAGFTADDGEVEGLDPVAKFPLTKTTRTAA